MNLKSNSGEISVFVVEPELAEFYENKMLDMRLLEPEVKSVKRSREEEVEKKEEVKPKRKVGR